MITMAHLLAEIVRTAKTNGGVPLGRHRFYTETGIKDTDWMASIGHGGGRDYGVARAAGVSARRAFGLRVGRSPLHGLLALNVDTPQCASIASLPSQNRLQAHEADRIDRLSSFHARSVSRMLEGPALPHGRHRLARRRPRAHHAALIDSRPSP